MTVTIKQMARDALLTRKAELEGILAVVQANSEDGIRAELGEIEYLLADDEPGELVITRHAPWAEIQEAPKRVLISPALLATLDEQIAYLYSDPQGYTSLTIWTNPDHTEWVIYAIDGWQPPCLTATRVEDTRGGSQK